MSIPHSLLLKMFRQLHLDHGLARYAQVPRFAVKSRYHPGRKIDIDTLRFLSRAAGLNNIKLVNEEIGRFKEILHNVR